MDFVDDFGAKVNKYSLISKHNNRFCIKNQDHSLTFNN